MFLTLFFFFFNDTATTEIYTLSLHDALPISAPGGWRALMCMGWRRVARAILWACPRRPPRWSLPPSFMPMRGKLRSEEHTSELQSQSNLVCRLLLEKKKNTKANRATEI